MKASYPGPLQNRIDLLREAAERAERKLREARTREAEAKRALEIAEMRKIDASRAYAGKVSASQPGVIGSATEADVREAEAAHARAHEELKAVQAAIGDMPAGAGRIDPAGLHALAISQRALLEGVEEFLSTLPEDAELVAAHAPPGSSESASEEGLAAIRAKLAEREAERSRVAASVPSAEHERDFLRAWAARRGAELEVEEIGIGTRVGRQDARQDRRPIFAISNPSTLTLLAAVAPEALVSAIVESLDRQAAKKGLVLDPEERARRLAECDLSLLSIQRSEEAIVTALAASGVHVPRRRFADPRAVLMVEVAAAVAEAAE